MIFTSGGSVDMLKYSGIEASITPGNRRWVLPMLVLVGLLVFSLNSQSEELPGIVKVGKGDEPLIPPFKMDCTNRSGKTPSLNERFKLAVNMAEHGQHAHDEHVHHKAMMNKGYQLNRVEYPIPDVELISHEGDKQRLPELLDTDRPVMLNFIFTTCTTICPVLSASFHQVQEILGQDSKAVSMISITIDPDYDTPEQLMKYAKRFKAGDQWRFYTGTYNDVVAVEKAFDIFRGSKMNHEPITLIRARNGQSWTRIDGLASAEDIVREYRELVASGIQ
jgi:protein SCO1/2